MLRTLSRSTLDYFVSRRLFGTQKVTMPPKKRKTDSKEAAVEKKTKQTANGDSSTDSDSQDLKVVLCTRPANYKIASWNVNGIRAWEKKDGLKFLADFSPDMLMVQETKCGDKDMPDSIRNVHGYHSYWQSSDNRDGYAGVGLYSKDEPLNVEFGMGIEEHDKEGRLVTAEYDNFYLVGAFLDVPNSGRGLPRLEYRTTGWDVDLSKYLKDLDSKKPVIYCGDLNVAHTEIDLANPKTNSKTAGFTKEERQGFTNLLGEGFIDSFRQLYPKKTKAYTFWSYMGNARAKNVGWRLDYFVLSERLKDSICDVEIHSEVMGSDHCPITLALSMQ